MIDAVHVRPARINAGGRSIPGRFDTVLVGDGSGGDLGLAGKSIFLDSNQLIQLIDWLGWRVAQVRLIFHLPVKAAEVLFPDQESPRPAHLAYVDWFTPFTRTPDAVHGLYKVSHCFKDGARYSGVVPVSSIKRGVHLYPDFGVQVPREWTSSTVLEQCQNFYVNPFADRHSYVTMY